MFLGFIVFVLFLLFFACIEASVDESKVPDKFENCMNRLETALQERPGEKNGKDQKSAEKKKPKSSTCTAKPNCCKEGCQFQEGREKKTTAKKAPKKSKGEGKLNLCKENTEMVAQSVGRDEGVRPHTGL